MKFVRTIGLGSAIFLGLAVGCKSDDDPAASAEGTGGVAGNSAATGGKGAGGNSGANTSPESDSGSSDKLPSIAGTYTDGFQTQTISEGIWRIDTSVFHITILNNVDDFLIASNDASNPWDPNKWSRFDWTRTSTGDLYYCQTAYDADSEQQAANTARPNTQDLAKGCGSFAWTKLTPIAADAGI